MNIILFRTKNCPKCKILEQYLDNLEVKYTKANLEGRGSGKYKAMLLKRGILIFATPALMIDEQLYRENQLMKDGSINPEIKELLQSIRQA